MKNWQIIREFIISNEDDFMAYLEEQHEIEGSDMDYILDRVEIHLNASGEAVDA